MDFSRIPLLGRLTTRTANDPTRPNPFTTFRLAAWNSNPMRRVRGGVEQVRGRVGELLQTARQSVSALQASEVLGQGRASLRAHIGLIVGFSAAINLLYLAPSLYMLQVYDRVLPTSGVLTLVLLSVVLIASLSVLALLDAVRARLLARAGLRIERLAADAVIEENMKARRMGSAPSATVRELDALRQGVTSPAAIGLLDIPWTPLFIGICFLIHFWIGVLALAGAALIFGLALINERASRDALSKLSSKTARFYVAHDSDLNAAETIHALGVGRRLRQRRAHARASYVEAQTETAFKGAGFSAATKALRMLLQSAALGLGAYLAVEREISPGAIIAATILTARAFAPVEQIVGGWRQIGLALAAYGALRRLFADAKPPLQRTPLPEPVGRIQVEQVAALAPDGRTVALQNASFSVGPGEIVGIIGPSGAGKTTLARVLANAAVVKMGAVRIDGARYADWDEEALARHIGYLPQRIELFDGTVAENIASFAALVDEQGVAVGPQIVEAATLAGAHEMILRLPNGYETELGTAGAGISPGQAQRIALARALFASPRVVVLDEPNSHLDADGEAALVGALEAMKGRGGVVFVVAHRAGVISIADKVIVLQEGRIVEFGPKAGVLAKLASMGKAQVPGAATAGAHQ
jgi:ATP-binding cassette subfamily C protein